MIKYFITTLLVLASASMISAQHSLKEFIRLHDLKGVWKMTASKGTVYEIWEIINDSTLKGKSFSVKDKDSVLQETINLTYAKGQIVYTPTVAEQNQNKPVSFPLTIVEGNQFIFINNLHDFPQRIAYTLLGNDNLLAVVSGQSHKGVKAIPYRFKKVRK